MVHSVYAVGSSDSICQSQLLLEEVANFLHVDLKGAPEGSIGGVIKGASQTPYYFIK